MKITNCCGTCTECGNEYENMKDIQFGDDSFNDIALCSKCIKKLIKNLLKEKTNAK